MSSLDEFWSGRTYTLEEVREIGDELIDFYCLLMRLDEEAVDV